ncbi:hypothetical protein ACTMTI_28295 [Nonomuraea sp. H19]|uniref:hypothetical protein n=1 Tax=Nonomuraea sp. H19 TaxID=3452206 RepID=UPI003F88F583
MNSLDDWRPGSAFSGVYHPQTGALLAHPSIGSFRFGRDEIPKNTVQRRQGHVYVENRFNDVTGRPKLDLGIEADRPPPTDLVGFTAILRDDGSIGMSWLSRSVSGRNESFPGVETPEHLRGPIMDQIRKATNRRVLPHNE